MAPTPRPDLAAPRLGLLAFGDSITNGGGGLQWGVASQSWALWTARGLGLPYTGYAVDGARARDVVTRQIPAHAGRSAAGEAGRYDLGCLYIGVNDVRGLDWDAEAFAADHDRALGFLAGCCDRLLAVTPPLALGRPRAGAKVRELGAVVRASAGAHAALALDLSDFGARNRVMVDHVHPTALGQVAIARRALAVLAADGMAVRVDPATLVAPSSTWLARARGDAAYVVGDLREHARTAGLHARAAAPRWAGAGRSICREGLREARPGGLRSRSG